ncbi:MULTISPECIES: hypothetical protein [unclassified Streptomyces]|uniref:hypothetical protein n=1 Tax=unclassified Streptomyces TaxID=2593676 RepID=UPI00114D24A7|nr:MULTISPECIES: hypothetical protein [unclassified Streptomyces]MYS23701.1 hypothetical protein [Streptomyces sp. SID4948]
MRASIRRAGTASALTTGVLMAALMGPGSASATPVNAPAKAGTLKNAASGIPKTMRHGQTVHMTLYYKQNSPDILVPSSFGVSLYKTGGNTSDELRGITASWWDQVTHRWERFSWATKEGDIYFDLPASPAVKVGSGILAHVYIRLTFGTATPSGVWHFWPQLDGYSLLDKHGKSVNAYLDGSDKDIRMYQSTLRS